MPPEIHITTQGERWDSIAYDLWGEERLMHHLVAANPDHIDVLVFPAGVRLTVPAGITRADATAEVPPWRR